MEHYTTIAKALSYIRQNVQSQPDLDAVAAYVNLSPFHFQRLFTEWAGVSPKKLLQFLTLKHAKQALAQTANLAEAAQACGLSGTSRLHDLFMKIEHVTPGSYKNKGKGHVVYYSTGNCVFGDYLVASTEIGICHLHFYQDFDNAFNELKQTWSEAHLIQFKTELHEQVALFLDCNTTDLNQEIKLHLAGTPFQLKVWEALLRIPEGHLTSYSKLAREIGQPTASRAVGTAIGSNPIAFLIPCHRIIKSVGGIGEYRWGSERKMAMIGWEAANAEPLAVATPTNGQLHLI